MKKKTFYLFSILLLLINLVYRFIDQSQMIKYFPLDYVNDGSSYMAQLFFMDVCGFHNFCPYWYNGFESFLFTPPGWFFFGLIIYKLVGSITLATYFSLVISFVSAFLIIYFLYGKLGLTKLQRVLMFFLLFGSAQAVGSFIRLVRVHELFAWVWFLLFAFIVLWYKDHKFDLNFFWIIIPYGMILLSYQSVAVFSTIFLLGLFLVKDWSERIKIIFAGLLTALWTSFWWFDYIFRSSEGSLLELQQAKWLWNFSYDFLVTNIISFIIPLILIVIFYFYFKQERENFLFFSPILLLVILFFLRIVGFIPILREIFPDPYLFFFSFFIVYLFLRLDLKKIPFGKFIPFLLCLIVFFVVLVSLFYTPLFIVPNDPIIKDALDLASYANDGLFLLGNFERVFYSNAFLSYIPIEYNLTTPYGWYPEYIPLRKKEKFQFLLDKFQEGDCDGILELLHELEIKETLVYKCEFVERCGLEIKKRGVYSCLVLTP